MTTTDKSDKTYSTRANAARAARTALATKHPRGAISGVHFRVTDADAGYGWEIIEDGGAAPVKERKSPPPKKMTEAELLEQGRKNSAAIRGEAAKDAIADTKDKSPTPAVAGRMSGGPKTVGTQSSKPDAAALYAALGGTVKAPRWRRPKRTEPGKVAYKPRAGSLQARMYTLLTQVGPKNERGVTVEEFCDAMAKAGAKPTMLSHEQTWSNLGYLFVSQKGYGLEFDGERIWLLVPKDERDAPAAASKKGG